MRHIKLLSLVSIPLLLSGCLTVTRGTTTGIMIVSEPNGAQASAVLLDRKGRLASTSMGSGQLSCSPTPCNIVIPRKRHARINVSKLGYQPIKFVVVSKGSGPTSTIKPGTIVAGIAPGSHVIAGNPNMVSKISGNTLAAAQILLTLGASTAIDVASGANRSFSPNPVVVVLAKDTKEDAYDE